MVGVDIIGIDRDIIAGAGGEMTCFSSCLSQLAQVSERLSSSKPIDFSKIIIILLAIVLVTHGERGLTAVTSILLAPSVWEPLTDIADTDVITTVEEGITDDDSAC